DSIVIQSGGTVSSDTGTVTLNVGVGDVDNDAVLTINGTVIAANVTLSSPGDIVLGQISASGTLTVTSTGGSIRDDGDKTTFIEAPNISLTAAKNIGGYSGSTGNGQISRNDVLNRSGNFLGTIDFDLEGGTLTLRQTGAGGNILMRNVDGTTNTSVLGG